VESRVESLLMWLRAATTENHAVAKDFPIYCQPVSKDSLSLQIECTLLKTLLMKALTYIPLLLMCLLFASCQKVDLGEETEVPEGKNLVTFKVKQFEQKDFDKAKSRATEISSLCKHIELIVYKDGARVNKVSQSADDKGYGTLSVALVPGTYRAVILAHNQDKSPTTTEADKISFGSDVSDAFLWSQDITVEDGKELDVDATMHRVVAMVRIVTTDNIPSNVATMQFYYTGGSSTLDALTGIGCVKSRQTVKRTVTDAMRGKPGTFEMYTFPRSDSETLHLEITALDANGNTVCAKTFENVPVTVNRISEYDGALFTNGVSGGDVLSKFHLTTNDEWTTVKETF
jgi:hypothetical protein